MNDRFLSRGWPALLLVALGVAQPSLAAPIPWQTERVDYVATNAPLADALASLAAQAHVTIDVAPDVHGTVSGRFNLAPQQFLSTMAASYGVSWYYDGMVLHVAPQADARTLALRLNYATTDSLLAQLSSTGASDTRFVPQVDQATHTVVVHGPPAYVARVDATARALERAARERVRTAVRVVQLTTARVTDRHETVGGVPSVMPGVVTRLRERFVANYEKPFADGIVPREYEAPLPLIEADVDHNAVRVRDRPERLDADAQMIRDYDTKPQLVRVAAYIADVEPDALASLPLQWRTVADAAPDAYALPGTPPAPRFAYSDDDGTALAAQLKEFVAEGRAKMELERDATTVDGTTVELNRRESALVAAANEGVGGAGSDASLLDVAEGVKLVVTPTVDGTLDMPHVALDTQFALGDGAASRVRVDVASKRAVLIAAAPAHGVAPEVDGSTGNEVSDASPRTRVVLLIPVVGEQ
ncbi:secretin N-terminal domain-containing protein [Trinickia fusca]|uniref:secretin N-terminal domain-containing protein n=1 Tax=Trinickia fusca TaxID=2419777 RepID=UPI0011C3FC6E|nr:secretin N-terminal domain-containing protein [Trinickia fusca]